MNGAVGQPHADAGGLVERAEDLLLHAGEHGGEDGEEQGGDDEGAGGPVDVGEGGQLEGGGGELGDYCRLFGCFFVSFSIFHSIFLVAKSSKQVFGFPFFSPYFSTGN